MPLMVVGVMLLGFEALVIIIALLVRSDLNARPTLRDGCRIGSRLRDGRGGEQRANDEEEAVRFVFQYTMKVWLRYRWLWIVLSAVLIMTGSLLGRS